MIHTRNVTATLPDIPGALLEGGGRDFLHGII